MPRDQRLYMTFPIDFWKHPKVSRLSDAAFRAFVESNGYSRERESDGVLEADDAEFLWSAEALAELVKSHPTRPLMFRNDDSDYVLRDYAEHQFTKADRDELTEKRAKAGRASAAKRQARAEHVLNTNQHPATGIERGIEISPPKGGEGAPSPFCRYHPDGTDQPCRGCATARLKHEAFKDALKAKKSTVPDVRREQTCTIHAEYPVPCIRCEEGT